MKRVPKDTDDFRKKNFSYGIQTNSRKFEPEAKCQEFLGKCHCSEPDLEPNHELDLDLKIFQVTFKKCVIFSM